jgi:glutamate synthase domain-containing protein 2/rubredoxin
MCGQLYDDDKEDVKFVDLPDSWSCPICGAPKNLFEPIEEVVPDVKEQAKPTVVALDYDTSLIQNMAATGQTVIEPAGTRYGVANWRDIVILSGQLASKPLDDKVKVNLETVIGRKARQPMKLGSPIIVSHMSYGALSKENKVAIAKGAAAIGTAVGSGEGGILPAELASAPKYIFEYVPNLYSVSPENLAKVDAVEIKIGQSAKPGLGGHLPAEKVSAEIAKMRGRKAGEEIISPPAFERINSVWDLLVLVQELREATGGKPIGVKIAANKIEEDLAWVKQSTADFVTIDGRGGGTGAAPNILKDIAGVPTHYALHRARKFLDKNEMENVSLIATGGLRTSGDFVKALAMGADAVAVATSVLTAMAAPGDLATEQKVGNFLKVSHDELAMWTRAIGKDDVHELSVADLATSSREISEFTNIKHV